MTPSRASDSAHARPSPCDDAQTMALRPCNPRSMVVLPLAASANLLLVPVVVWRPVAGQPFAQLSMRIGLRAFLEDLGAVGRVVGKLDREVVRRGDVERHAVAVVGFVERVVRGLQAALDLLVGLEVDLD